MNCELMLGTDGGKKVYPLRWSGGINLYNNIYNKNTNCTTINPDLKWKEQINSKQHILNNELTYL